MRKKESKSKTDQKKREKHQVHCVGFHSAKRTAHTDQAVRKKKTKKNL